jgi:hypothetical protein
MYPLALRIAPYAVLAVLAGVTGWTVNGWRLGANINALKAEHATLLAKSTQDARNRELELQRSADAQRRHKDAQIKTINTRLAAALDSLRDRPSRNDLPADAPACSGATGAELSRESASDIVREAARADQTVEMLNYCIAQYSTARDLSRK